MSCPRRDIEGDISRLRAREFDSFAERARVTVDETAAVGCGCWTLNEPNGVPWDVTISSTGTVYVADIVDLGGPAFTSI